MYRAFYQLTSSVNRKDIAVDELFESNNFKEAISRLEFIKDKGGFAVVSEKPGVGKTTLVRYFAEKLNPRFYKVAYAPLSTVSVIDFYRQISILLSGEAPSQKSQLFRNIQETILESAIDKKIIPIIIFDEAHLLKTQNFHELQILSNFNLDSLSPALFILIAQPYLLTLLKKTAMEAFYQRIKIKIPVLPLSKSETLSFIAHTMKSASSSDNLFSSQALELVYDISKGTKRIVTKVLEQALIYGASNNLKSIDEQVIHKITPEL